MIIVPGKAAYIDHKVIVVTSVILVDECALGIDDCHDNAECTDTIDAYECECNEGYEAKKRVSTA